MGKVEALGISGGIDIEPLSHRIGKCAVHLTDSVPILGIVGQRLGIVRSIIFVGVQVAGLRGFGFGLGRAAYFSLIGDNISGSRSRESACLYRDSALERRPAQQAFGLVGDVERRAANGSVGSHGKRERRHIDAHLGSGIGRRLQNIGERRSIALTIDSSHRQIVGSLGIQTFENILHSIARSKEFGVNGDTLGR